MPPVLPRETGTPVDASGCVLPAAIDRILRRHRERARDLLARGRQFEPAALPELWSGRGDAGSRDDVAHRRLLDEAVHQAVFTFVLTEVARRGLLKGKTIGIDATTLEANVIAARPGKSTDFSPWLAGHRSDRAPLAENGRKWQRFRQRWIFRYNCN